MLHRLSLAKPSSGVDRAATAAFVPAGSCCSGSAGACARQGPRRSLAHRSGVPARRGRPVLRTLQRTHRRPALPRGRRKARLRALSGHGRVPRTRPPPTRALRRLGRPHRRRTPSGPGQAPPPRPGTPEGEGGGPHSSGRLTDVEEAPPPHRGRLFHVRPCGRGSGCGVATWPDRSRSRCRPAACSAGAPSRSAAPSRTSTASRSSRWSRSPTDTAPPAATPRP